MNSKKKPRVVVVGGGTGMPVLLRGLKYFPIDLSAIVTVADDGGSSGRLRSEMEIPAPGDIRNVIAALSEAEPMLLDLFQHRFKNGGNGLNGHSMGNLLLAAMTSLTGDFYYGIKEISRVLNVQGRIYPIANQNMYLHAEMDDGTVVSGESNIPLANKKIKRVFLSPEPVLPLPEAVKALENAELVVVAPGSLYTSTLPNMIVPQIEDALRNTKAKVVYVCNVMTQEGETSGYTVADHVQAIYDHIGYGCIHSILVHNKPIIGEVREVYAEENAEPVIYDIDRLSKMGLEIIEGDIIDDQKKTLRHDTKKVAQLLYSLISF
ncbi:YvcK family protein [Aquibacillus sp. 3ASR75-11]|uniref:Gluconeogenesis factor n=1 Tax=Terrihalobacillus insolitus TaxID=2950438 RepID=A0A9X4AK92_9BACI|nr:YvcK family protein [Terrihalobacillus insolitus]MDC3412270.1 YvcK family protein [Terrihalobacillus insolitus]MDC3423037.1 YvcK family protein [Terrihalobacillus insolitus]